MFGVPGFNDQSIHFRVFVNRSRPGAMMSNESTIWLGRSTEESRGSLNSLRAFNAEKNDVAAFFEEAMEECRMGTSIEASLPVVGELSEMRPKVRDETYRTGYEATRNACIHSQVTFVELT